METHRVSGLFHRTSVALLFHLSLTILCSLSLTSAVFLGGWHLQRKVFQLFKPESLTKKGPLRDFHPLWLLFSREIHGPIFSAISQREEKGQIGSISFATTFDFPVGFFLLGEDSPWRIFLIWSFQKEICGEQPFVFVRPFLLVERHPLCALKRIERVELSSFGWKPKTLPLSYIRLQVQTDSNLYLRFWKPPLFLWAMHSGHRRIWTHNLLLVRQPLYHWAMHPEKRWKVQSPALLGRRRVCTCNPRIDARSLRIQHSRGFQSPPLSNQKKDLKHEKFSAILISHAFHKLNFRHSMNHTRICPLRIDRPLDNSTLPLHQPHWILPENSPQRQEFSHKIRSLWLGHVTLIKQKEEQGKERHSSGHSTHVLDPFSMKSIILCSYTKEKSGTADSVSQHSKHPSQNSHFIQTKQGQYKHTHMSHATIGHNFFQIHLTKSSLTSILNSLLTNSVDPWPKVKACSWKQHQVITILSISSKL